MINGFDKNKKYYGEIWFAESEDERQFCVLFFKEDKIWLETNLHSKQRHYKETQILGSFTGVGYFTFIDCRIQYSSSGITETRIYAPKYTFVSDKHFINTQTLKVSDFYIDNDVIAKWIYSNVWYDSLEDKLHRKELTDIYDLTESGLKITIKHFQNIKMEEHTSLRISNRGAVKFELPEPVTILEAMGLYDQFQKVLQLVFGRSAKFRRFCFKCMGCGEYKDLYYNDTRLTKSTSTFIHTYYEKINDSLQPILNAAFANDTFRFCLDRLMENFIGTHTSHNKRFTNSISAYEAYYKNYSKVGKTQLDKRIKENDEIFKRIGDFKDDDWASFPKKVVRARDYYIHSNSDNKGVYSEFELLYISFLFDYVIAYLLLLEIDGVQPELLDEYIKQGKSTFVDMQRTNVILGSNPLT